MERASFFAGRKMIEKGVGDDIEQKFSETASTAGRPLRGKQRLLRNAQPNYSALRMQKFQADSPTERRCCLHFHL